jgi:hypothetical protein
VTVTYGQWPCGRLVVVVAFEVIWTVAALLWIGVVLAVLIVAARVLVKTRARRRRINRLLGAARIPLLFGDYAIAVIAAKPALPQRLLEAAATRRRQDGRPRRAVRGQRLRR